MIKFDEMDLTTYNPEQRQSDTIDLILNNLKIKGCSTLKKEYKKGIEYGICYMMSMEWMRLTAVYTNEKIWKEDFGSRDHVENELKYYQQIASNYFSYASEQYGVKPYLVWNNNYESMETDKNFVEFGTGKQLKVTAEADAYNPEQMADQLLNSEKWMFIRLNLVNAAHQIAAYRKDNLTLYVYDPNIGTIEITAISEAELKVKAVHLLSYLWQYLYGIQSAYIRYVRS